MAYQAGPEWNPCFSFVSVMSIWVVWDYFCFFPENAMQQGGIWFYNHILTCKLWCGIKLVATQMSWDVHSWFYGLFRMCTWSSRQLCFVRGLRKGQRGNMLTFDHGMVQLTPQVVIAFLVDIEPTFQASCITLTFWWLLQYLIFSGSTQEQFSQSQLSFYPYPWPLVWLNFGSSWPILSPWFNVMMWYMAFNHMSDTNTTMEPYAWQLRFDWR